MNISKKLSIIVTLTIIEISFTIWAAFQISKGATFHQLNSLHLKFNAVFSEQVVAIQRGDRMEPEVIRSTIEDIREQPIQCLKQVNILDKMIMKQIGTDYALDLCEKDIADADKALQLLTDYVSGTLDRDLLLEGLVAAAAAFNDNSTKFEAPITRTVSFIFQTMIPMVIFISLFNILFITYLSKTISGSIGDVIALLSEDSDDDSFVERIDRNVSGELKELLLAAKDRIKRDLFNREMTKELERLVDQRTVSLQRANDELAQFAYRASHDLKGPLTTTKELAKYIDQDIGSGNLDEARENAKNISSLMMRLEDLVVDILALAKADLDSGEKESVDFNELLTEVVERLSWLKQRDTVDIIQQIKLTDQPVVERARVAQIIENLLSNSIKYLNASADTPYVKVMVSDESRDIHIEIEDNGLGIPDDRKDDVFKMFKRFHPTVSSGSGLGMAIVKKHIDYMGGTIRFHSSNNGTRFNITIPKSGV